MDFIGRDALINQTQSPLTKVLACFTVEDANIVLLGRETIYRNGKRVGWLSSAGWGYTVNTNIGYGYVRNDAGIDNAYLLSGSYELDVAGESVPARIHLRPLYDPDGLRVRS
jgi:4-methylaminobutanoate oxidase (formaldehyde-forming)